MLNLQALVKIYSKVKEAMALAATPPTGLEESQILEQHPIGDEEMELEEGLAATEQVIQLLEQIISQGKQSLDDERLSMNPFNVTRGPSEENLETFEGYGKKHQRKFLIHVT